MAVEEESKPKSTRAPKKDVVVENGGEEAKTFPKAEDDAAEADAQSEGSEDAAATADGSEPADIAAATEFDPSGAPEQVVGEVDPSHPAVDDNPRANTSVDQNRIDFNDPGKSGQDVVAEQLGMKKPGDA